MKGVKFEGAITEMSMRMGYGTPEQCPGKGAVNSAAAYRTLYVKQPHRVLLG